MFEKPGERRDSNQLFTKKMDKDYEKYAYFYSRAKNYGIVMKAEHKRTVDGEVVRDVGIRIEFHNGMLKLEKTKENAEMIKYLRKKIEEEKGVSLYKKSFVEEFKPEKTYTESEVKELLLAQKDKNEK
jgi:hypothetical protein